MVDQESQTISTELHTSPLKTNQMFNGIHNPYSKATDHSTWASNSTEHSLPAITNANNDDGDDYDPLYAIPNNLGTKNNVASQQNNKSSMVVHPNNHRMGNNASSPPHNTSSETNSSAHLNPLKSSSPSSVPNYSRNINLERSQSLRVSRKSQRSLSSTSKGGSLRYIFLIIKYGDG